MRNISRRTALKGGTAAVAAIAGAGAVTARVAVEDPAIEAAAEVYWGAKARRAEVPHSATDEEYHEIYFGPTFAAYDALMKIPATSLRGCGIKARVYRHQTLDLVDGYMNNFDLDGLLADIERLAGEG